MTHHISNKPLKGEERRREAARLAEHRRKGASLQTLTELSGFSESTVRKLLDNAGIPPRRNTRNLRGEERQQLAAVLAKRYKNQTPVRELAEEFGISYGLTHVLLTEAGVCFRRRGGSARTVKKGTASKRPTPQQVDLIEYLVRRVGEGAKRQELAEETGWSLGTIYRLLKTVGVTRTNGGRAWEAARKGPLRAGPERERFAAELRRRYEDDSATVRQLAEETGYSSSKIHRLLKIAGTQFRACGGAESTLQARS
ncbi:helix-turn-helix domain-containing protein [Streptomyces xiamenensis]|uniref:helix-turn-helix domain-containing protein n=1 Tax=Streptomyces xiamenensis TaxID=408015 RepID=UPI0036EA2716